MPSNEAIKYWPSSAARKRGNTGVWGRQCDGTRMKRSSEGMGQRRESVMADRKEVWCLVRGRGCACVRVTRTRVTTGPDPTSSVIRGIRGFRGSVEE